MREILFKAKRKDNGEWVEGLPQKMWGELHIINMNDENTAYPIDPETICQYTGVVDKSGNRIWENDIVKSTASEDRRDWKLWKVVFVDGSFVFDPIAYVDKTRKKLRIEDEVLCEDNVKFYGLEWSGNIYGNTPTEDKYTN